MGKLKLRTDAEIDMIFANYPDFVRDKMCYLCELVIKTAEETESIRDLEETLKMGRTQFYH
ncbi:MAG: hypothetical protein AAGH81_08760 [Bacteroidota bacterium]